MKRAYHFTCIATILAILTTVTGLSLVAHEGGESGANENLEPVPEMDEFSQCPVELIGFSEGVFFYICDSCTSPGNPTTEQSSNLHMTMCFTTPLPGAEGECACSHVSQTGAKGGWAANSPPRAHKYQDNYITMQTAINLPRRMPHVRQGDSDKWIVATFQGRDYYFRLFEFEYLNSSNVWKDICIAQELDPDNPPGGDPSDRWTVDLFEIDDTNHAKVTLQLRYRGQPYNVGTSIKDVLGSTPINDPE